jgi:hypothetical protein
MLRIKPRVDHPHFSSVDSLNITKAHSHVCAACLRYQHHQSTITCTRCLLTVPTNTQTHTHHQERTRMNALPVDGTNTHTNTHTHHQGALTCTRCLLTVPTSPKHNHVYVLSVDGTNITKAHSHVHIAC